MLTKKENLLQTIRGGTPDRFVNQYEFMNIILESPNMFKYPAPGTLIKDGWGITWTFPVNQLGIFPVHTDEYKVLKDITEWRKCVHAPDIPTADEAWAAAIAHANAVNREEEFVTGLCIPGIFEMTHHLMGVENALMSFYEEPEAMHELIGYITEYELNLAQVMVDKLHPECIFHHDDWGSQTNSIMSPKMFDEFIVPAYKKVYGYYKSHGVKLIVHHSDSYAANLVPYMVDMGIDIWQGAMSTNNIPDLISKYGGIISFMGHLDNATIDIPDWTPELCAKAVEEACKSCGKLYFIPCLVQGLNYSSFPGVYDTVSKEIDRMSKEMF